MKQEHAHLWPISQECPHPQPLNCPATAAAPLFPTVSPSPVCTLRDRFTFGKLPQAQTGWLFCSQHMLWEAANLQVMNLPSLPAGLTSNESVTEDDISGLDFNV